MNPSFENNPKNIRELSIDELAAVNGGSIKWIKSQIEQIVETAITIVVGAVTIGALILIE